MKKQELIIKELYRLKKSDLKKCAQVASRAFMDDETSKFLLSSKLTQEALYEYYYIIYKAIYEKMHIFADSDDINGFIIVSPIVNAEISLWDFIKAGGLKVIASLGLDLITRSLAYENNCIKIRRQFIAQDDWYLFKFGVDPQKQGKGLGSNIIKPFLNWLDSKHISCYLETQKEVNVEIYGHLGFNLKSVDTLPKTPKKQYAMLRS